MLVITRRLNESILVGDNVRIVILGIDGDRIKIGIEAPASLKILRAELFAEVRDVNREAIVTDLASLQSLLGATGQAGPADGALAAAVADGQPAADAQPAADGQPAANEAVRCAAQPGGSRSGNGDEKGRMKK